MSSIVIAGDTSGSVTLQAPAVSGSTVITLPSTSTTLVSSQWTTTGSNIYYNTGNVGIGTSSPTLAKLQVAGTAYIQDTLTISSVLVGANITDATGSNITLKAGNSNLFVNQGSGFVTATVQGVERIRFNSTGAAVLSGGNTSADGVGITFPATQSASTDANTLDDYEEGTWSPTMSASSSGTITMNGSFTSGKYTKVGRLVVCTATMYVGSVSSPTGNLYINGLPFTVGTPSSAACGWYNGLTSSANNALVFRVDNSSTSILTQGFSSGVTAAAAPWVKAATEMNLTVTYFV